MRIHRFLTRSSPRTVALVLALFTLLCGTSFAATDWSAIQAALGADGVELPGNVLRFELVRGDLTVTINGTALPDGEQAEVANGYLGFKKVEGSHSFFVDGSLPAQESELAALELALRQNNKIHITAIVNHVVLETPKLVWVHFEATGNGAELATSLAEALKTIHSPQLNVLVIPGTNTVFDPSLLPPQFQKLFEEGWIEQLNHIFVFYLPRPDEHRITVGPVKAETGLGVGQSFYIQIPSFEGGTNQVTLHIDFALRADEIQPVEDELRAGGFAISAQHNQFVNDSPHLYFVHASASGDGVALGNTLLDVIQIIEQQAKRNHDHDHDWDD